MEPPLRHLPTLRQLLMLLAFACVLPMAALSLAMVVYQYQHERRHIEATAIGTARALMAAVDDRLDSVERSLQANTDVHTARANLRQARALITVQNATLLPRVDASGSAQRSKTGNTPAGSLYRAGFDASWEPDVFGANRAGLSAAQADALASAATLGDVQVRTMLGGVLLDRAGVADRNELKDALERFRLDCLELLRGLGVQHRLGLLHLQGQPALGRTPGLLGRLVHGIAQQRGLLVGAVLKQSPRALHVVGDGR